MKRLTAKSLICIMIVAVCLSMFSCAMGAISSTVILRASRVTQSAVINVGEDLSMEVLLEGVEPASYQWYFKDEPIEGANRKTYSIIDATLDDTGIYRIDAFDENGNLLISMDISARVIDPEIPKSGDRSIPVGIAFGALILAGMILIINCRPKTSR